MKNINIDQLDQIRRDCFATIKKAEPNSDNSIVWFCLNCASEQPSEGCRVCYREDYLVPYSNPNQEFIRMQTLGDDLCNSIRQQVKSIVANPYREKSDFQI